MLENLEDKRDFMTRFPAIQEDLTQHFLYSYTHPQKIGPHEKLRQLFGNDLIFDKSRKSIFTQGQEFGYICDKQMIVDMGTYNTKVNSYLNVIAYEGEINAYTIVPWYVENFNITSRALSGKTTITPGTEIDIVNFTWNTFGSQYTYTLVSNSQYNTDNKGEIKPFPIERNRVSCKTLAVSYTVNNQNETYLYRYGLGENPANFGALINNSEGAESACIAASTPANADKFTTNKIKVDGGKLTFSIYISAKANDDNFPDVLTKSEISFDVKNYVELFEYGDDPSGTKNLTREDIKNTWLHRKGYGGPMPAANNKLKILSDDWGGETYLHPYKCSSLGNFYYVLMVPKRLQDADMIYGNLNNGTVQEFEKIYSGKHVESSTDNWLLSPFRASGMGIEDYNIYLSYGRNWGGFYLSFPSNIIPGENIS